MKAVLRSMTALALVLALTATFAPMSNAQENPESLFQTKCSKCHNLDRSNITATSDEWWGIVLKMKKKFFSGISEEDAAIIHRYLVENRGK